MSNILIAILFCLKLLRLNVQTKNFFAAFPVASNVLFLGNTKHKHFSLELQSLAQIQLSSQLLQTLPFSHILAASKSKQNKLMPCITSLAPRIHFVVVSVRNRCNQRGFAAVIKPGFGVAINAVKCLLRITTVVCRAVQVVWGGRGVSKQL